MIEITDLQKRYGKKNIIQEITLQLEKTTYGLVGANGAGKTTLIRMIAGVIAPTKGTIMFDDRNARIGYLPQKYGCFPEITVYEQMEYFACLKKIDRKRCQDEINRVLEIVNMSDKRNEKCRKLSGGMVRRIGIAQALMGDPQLLLLDEPTVGLDFGERAHFNEIMHNLEGKMTIILSTHLIEDIHNVCKKVIFLQNGQVAGVENVDACNQSNHGLFWHSKVEMTR